MDKAQQRAGETGPVPFRNGRLHCLEGQWLFACRQGKLKGPYQNQEEAEDALRRYLAAQVHN